MISMIEIPLTPYPDQELQIDLGGQACTIRVFERAGFMYMDLTVRRTKILKGTLCQPTTPIIPKTVRGFSGQFYVIDDAAATAGSQESPAFSGWGTRYKLYWLPDGELVEMRALWEAQNG